MNFWKGLAWLGHMVRSGQIPWQRIAPGISTILKRRRGRTRKRPIADIFIGAFASRFDRLLTRNAKDFRVLFPELRLEEP